MAQTDTDIHYDHIPAHIRQAVQAYIEHGHIPGAFLQAIITNNLSRSFAYADEINRERLADIVGFFYNEISTDCWGSVEKMHAWAAHQGQRFQQVER